MVRQKKYSQSEINEILENNYWLEKENKFLKQLVNSKRFKFAEKIATAFNSIFPASTKRRNVFNSVIITGNHIVKNNQKRLYRKRTNKLKKILKNYKKIIVINGIPWDTKLKQRPHHLATEFQELGFLVIYLEDNPLHPFRKIKEGIITINNYKLLKEIIIKGKNYYFLTPNNIATPLPTLKEIKSCGFEIIYDFLDEFHEDISGSLSVQLEVWKKLSTLKPIVCLATAEKLYKQIKKHLGSNQKVIMARNAVNINHFNYQNNSTKTPPLDLIPIIKSGHPIIGFYGALAAWIDIELINQLAKENPELEIVLLGVDYDGSASKLKKFPNLHNLGVKNYKDLSSYTKYFNCAIIPFKRGEIAKATSPVKLFEYMAAGLPTICTKDLSECRGYEYVYIAEDNKDFIKFIKKALQDYKNPNSRKALLSQAKENTWKERAKCIENNLKK